MDPMKPLKIESSLTTARHLELEGDDVVGERDAALGRVEDFAIDDRLWEIPYLVLDTRPWWPRSKKVLVFRHWLVKVDEAHRRIHLSLTPRKVSTAPGFDHRPVTRDYELSLFQRYGRELAGRGERLAPDDEERVR